MIVMKSNILLLLIMSLILVSQIHSKALQMQF